MVHYPLETRQGKDGGRRCSVFQVRNRGRHAALCVHTSCDAEYDMRVDVHSHGVRFGGAVCDDASRASPDDGSLTCDDRNDIVHVHSGHNDDEALYDGRLSNPRSDLGNTNRQKVLFHSLEGLACC